MADDRLVLRRKLHPPPPPPPPPPPKAPPPAPTPARAEPPPERATPTRQYCQFGQIPYGGIFYESNTDEATAFVRVSYNTASRQIERTDVFTYGLRMQVWAPIAQFVHEAPRFNRSIEANRLRADDVFSWEQNGQESSSLVCVGSGYYTVPGGGEMRRLPSGADARVWVTEATHADITGTRTGSNFSSFFNNVRERR